MLYRKERINTIITELKKLIITKSISYDNWKIKEGTFFTPAEVDKSPVQWENFVCGTNTWGGNDCHFWFRAEIEVPKEFDNQDFWLTFGTNVNFWDAVNPQFLVFINDEVVQGADVNHKEVLVARKAVAGTKYKIDLQAYTGTNTHDSGDKSAKMEFYCSLTNVDEQIHRLYYDLLTPYQMISWLDEKNPNRTKLEVALNSAINILDLRIPFSNEFYNSVKETITFLEKEVYEKLVGTETVATCIGHTHIDVAWWWTVEQTREKSARSFSTVLKLMDEYPEYKFMSSQPVLYKFVKERYPEVFEKIKERVKEGRWEVEGGMWVEADCNVTSGESLVRQILHGKKFFKDEFGYDCKVVWLPDVFGYSANLPQIMKKSGIDYFMTTKIAWNQINKLPYDTFMWKGIDGSSIFTHLITTQDMHQGKDDFFTTYNGNLNSVSVIRAWERYQQKELNNDVLISYGYGDGGGGTTREMIEIGNRLHKGLAGAPKVRYEFSKKYFDELYERVGHNDKLPEWFGELYLEYHRGTYTSMARNKRGNRKCEFLWQDVEFISLWAEELGLNYPKQEIYDSWELILTNQFHDILPGSSIKAVYDVTKEEYTALENRAIQLIKDGIQKIADSTNANKDDVVVMNTLSFARDDIFIIDKDIKGLVGENGETINIQKTHDGKTIAFAKHISPKGISVFKPSDEHKVSNYFDISDYGIKTPFYDVTFNNNYEITSLIDISDNRQVLKENGKANVLTAYEDKPMNYDNWDIDIYYTEKKWQVDNVVKSEWIEKGPVRAILSVERKFCDSIIKQKITFYSQREGIDFDTYIDWKQHQVLLKAEFDVDINSHEATYDIQFGELQRPTHKNTSWDIARFEVCGHKWVDISEGNYGVSLINDSKYGHSVNDNKIGLTLLKSGIVPNPVTDQEEHRMTYTLYPHQNNHSESKTIELGYMINVPLYNAIKQTENNNNKIKSYVWIENNNAVIETVKKSEDLEGIIIRVIEKRNSRVKTNIHWNTNFKEVIECDLMENPINTIRKDSDNFQLELKPFEVKTFKIIL